MSRSRRSLIRLKHPIGEAILIGKVEIRLDLRLLDIHDRLGCPLILGILYKAGMTVAWAVGKGKLSWPSVRDDIGTRRRRGSEKIVRRPVFLNNNDDVLNLPETQR